VADSSFASGYCYLGLDNRMTYDAGLHKANGPTTPSAPVGCRGSFLARVPVDNGLDNPAVLTLQRPSLVGMRADG